MKFTETACILTQYGSDDYSMWIFVCNSDNPLELDSSRAVRGTLAEIFNLINENDEWALRVQSDEYVACPVKNREILTEKYVSHGYSERGTAEQIIYALEVMNENEEELENEEFDDEI